MSSFSDLTTIHPALLAALIIALGAAFTDLRTRTVPNRLVALGAVSGVFLNGLVSGGVGLIHAILGGVVGLCIFMPFYLLRGMGGGDIKLMGALGTCMGAAVILQAALVASFVGAGLALAVAARHGLLRRTLANTALLLSSWVRRGPRPSKALTLDNPKTLKIPYALPIAAGAIFIILQG